MNKKYLYFHRPHPYSLRTHLENLGIPCIKTETYPLFGYAEYNGGKVTISFNLSANPILYWVENTPTNMAFLFYIGALDIREDN